MEIDGLKKQRNWLRFGLLLHIAGTVAGNLFGAPTESMWISWSFPVVLLIMSETAIHVPGDQTRLDWVRHGALAVVLAATVFSSYVHLFHLALRLGLDLWVARAFPVVVDVGALYLGISIYQVSVRIRKAESLDAKRKAKRHFVESPAPRPQGELAKSLKVVPAAKPAPFPAHAFTDRAAEAGQLAAEGLTQAEIADRMDVSDRQVRRYLKHQEEQAS